MDICVECKRSYFKQNTDRSGLYFMPGGELCCADKWMLSNNIEPVYGSAIESCIALRARTGNICPCFEKKDE